MARRGGGKQWKRVRNVWVCGGLLLLHSVGPTYTYTPPFFCVPSHGPGPLFLENRASTVAPLYVLAFCVPAPFLREAASPGPELRTEAEEVA